MAVRQCYHILLPFYASLLTSLSLSLSHIHIHTRTHSHTHTLPHTCSLCGGECVVGFWSASSSSLLASCVALRCVALRCYHWVSIGYFERTPNKKELIIINIVVAREALLVWRSCVGIHPFVEMDELDVCRRWSGCALSRVCISKHLSICCLSVLSTRALDV